jgi:hypothetical protein
VKDWAKPPSDHVDPYYLGIRFVGFITANLLLRFLYWFAEFSDQLGLFSSSVAEDRIVPFVDPIEASYKFVKKKQKRIATAWTPDPRQGLWSSEGWRRSLLVERGPDRPDRSCARAWR